MREVQQRRSARQKRRSRVLIGQLARRVFSAATEVQQSGGAPVLLASQATDQRVRAQQLPTARVRSEREVRCAARRVAAVDRRSPSARPRR